MKIKRKQTSTLNGVKSSSTSDLKSETKFEAANKIDLTNKSGIIKSESIDKITDTTNGTNSTQMNGSIEKSVTLTNIKNSSLKDRKKSINNSNQMSSTTSNSLNKDEISKDETKLQLINDRLSKNNSQIDEDKNSTNSSPNNSNASFNSIENSNKEISNRNDLSSSNFKTAKRREFDFEVTNSKKKIKLDTEIKDISTVTQNNVSTMTDSECLGFAEPGTSVVLEGAILDEIEGVLVVNVTWRNKAYVGTLLDCTKHDWAPPRFCESPTSDLELRAGNRNCKRSRGSISESENNIKLQLSKLRNGKGRRNNFNVSPVREQQQSNNSNNGNAKRSNNSKSDLNKRSTPPLDNSSNNSTNSISTLNSTSTTSQSNQTKSQLTSQVLIECPEPNCNKKYKHINGLKYHQTHAHHDSNNNNLKSTSSNSNNNNNLLNSNKNEELSDSKQIDNEETDTEDFLDTEPSSSQSNVKSNKLNSNKMTKLSSKHNETNCSNKSPAYSDISDDTENESRPSSNNNSLQTSQSTNNNYASAKNEETKNPTNSQSNGLDATTTNKSSPSFPFLCSPSSGKSLNSSGSSDEHNNLKLSSSLNKEDQKTNDELRKLANEVDQKLTKNVTEQHSTDKLLLLNPNTTPASTPTTNPPPPISQQPNNNNSFFQNFPVDPSIHAYLIQTDLNYRLNYERYFMEQHQEQLLACLNKTSELDEIERERHKAFLLSQQQNSASANKESNFKSPSTNNNPPRPSSTTSKSLNDRQNSTANSSTAPGGSIVNGTSNLSQQQQQQNNKSTPSPYDFMEFEKPVAEKREEMFRLNSFKMEEQRNLLHSKILMPNSNSTFINCNSPNNSNSTKSTTTPIKDATSNGVNKVSNLDTDLPNSIPNLTNLFNFQSAAASFLNPSGLTSFMPTMPSNAVSVPHLAFDQNLFRGNEQLLHQTANIPQPIPSAFINSLNPLRFSSSLSPIDLNQQLLNNNNNKKTENLMNQEHSLIQSKSTATLNASNGLHRTANLSQNSSSTLNTSNNSNLSTSSKKDENRSPPSRHLNNAQHVGVVGFPPAPFIDPYGELIQAASSVCLIPYASK